MDGEAEAHHGDGEAGSHATPHAHGPGHFTDPARYAAAWNDPARDAWQRPDQIVAALALSPGETVVDVGAGTGYLLPPLVEAVGPEGEVVALDIEPAMLAWLDEAAEAEGWSTVRTHRGGMDGPALPAASVDAAVTLNVWHHIADRPAYARTLFDALRPGGVFVVVDFLAEETEGFGPPMAMRLSADQVAEDLRAGGFTVEIVDEDLPRHHIVRGRKPEYGAP